MIPRPSRSEKKYAAGGFFNVYSKTYFTFDASILRSLGCGAERAGWWSGTGRTSRIRRPGCSRRDLDALRRYRDAAGKHLYSDRSGSDTEHRPGFEFSKSADAGQQHAALQRKSEHTSDQPQWRPLRKYAGSSSRNDEQRNAEFRIGELAEL
ncbi:MAG TPA: hypothetical protein VK828_11870 [Terriglobales bacterium]|nr:hypothetical protein [Terriglobales bacterium]